MDGSIDKILDKKNKDIESGKNVYGTGKITKVLDFIVEAVGLENAFFYEKVFVGENSIGYITKLDANKVIISLLYKDKKINIGDTVTESGEVLSGNFSFDSIGKIIDLFGNDKLVNKKFTDTISIPVEHEIVPIMERTSINRPLKTGIAGIDLLYPIGKGQRQLILGDKKTGKTQIALDTIVNQADEDTICIYVGIGKTKKEIKELYYELLKRKATNYTIIITAFYDDLPPLLYLTPYFATSIADYYMKNGKDVLVVIDDLKRHADAYREISLLSGKSVGRDAYPADIFYSHARLLESGCQCKNGASITILPIVETKAGIITDYISTNVISITDGQIVLSSKNFQKGQKPAIDYGLSVSRLGGNVQTESMKKVGSKIKQLLLSYLETRDIYELANVDEMSPELRKKLFDGKKILDSFNQYRFSPLNFDEMIKMFSSYVEDDISEETVNNEINNNDTILSSVHYNDDNDLNPSIDLVYKNDSSLDSIIENNSAINESIGLENNNPQEVDGQQPVINTSENTVFEETAVPIILDDQNKLDNSYNDQIINEEQPIINTPENTVSEESAVPIILDDQNKLENLYNDQTIDEEQPIIIIPENTVSDETVILDDQNKLENLYNDQIIDEEQPIINTPENIVSEGNDDTLKNDSIINIVDNDNNYYGDNYDQY